MTSNGSLAATVLFADIVGKESFSIQLDVQA